jgi:transglutaminase-like putative cysteine protease
VDALLRYFRHHPPRLKTDPNDWDKNPVTVLRSSELLKICGSASAAFVFLARSLGIPARVLLLLNERGVTKHVVAEVWLDGRWVVVEPTFGLAMKDGNGRWLSKEELRDLATLRQATRHVAYPPTTPMTEQATSTGGKCPWSVNGWATGFGNEVGGTDRTTVGVGQFCPRPSLFLADQRYLQWRLVSLAAPQGAP